MFEWLASMLADFAFDTAVYSAGLASASGMCQPKEPEGLQELSKKFNK